MSKPLEGVRIVDLTVVWAGTFAATLLADLGAEVIKVENVHIWQPMTRGGMARPPRAMAQSGQGWATGYPNSDVGPRPWNYSPTFVQLYRNKHSMTVDLRAEEGRKIFKRLVQRSDALIENNAAGTLEKLGIGPDWLLEARPDLVMLRMPAYGLDGPYRDARALGVHLESVMGHTLLRGYTDLDPSYITSIYAGDYIAGAHGALAIMMGLRHRRRTGEGQIMEMAQAEGAGAMLSQAFLDYSLNGVVQERRGNASLYDYAPYNVYPCRSEGTGVDGGDRWISITALDDAQWGGLREAMGNPQWAADPAYATNAGRLAARQAIDAEIAAWTRDRDDYELMHRLQAAGVPAAPVLEASRVLDDQHVQARQLNEPQTLYDGVGGFRFNRPFYKFAATPVDVHKPPVAMGEDNDYVYREVLGYSEAEYEAFRTAGHVGMDYDETIR